MIELHHHFEIKCFYNIRNSAIFGSDVKEASKKAFFKQFVLFSRGIVFQNPNTFIKVATGFQVEYDGAYLLTGKIRLINQNQIVIEIIKII